MTSELFSDCPRAKLHLSLHFVNALHLSRDYMYVLTFHFNFLIISSDLNAVAEEIYFFLLNEGVGEKHYIFLFLKKGGSMTCMKEDLYKT